MRLQDKTALITGGASGIGLAIARRFVAEGARAAITGRNRAALDAAVAELGDAALAIEADATDVAATERAVAATAARFGAIDVLANAGIAAGTPRGVRVNVVSPGAIRTPIWSGFAPSSAARTALEERQPRAIPQGRIGDPDEVANAVLFFASPESAHVQAAELFVDGGLTGTPMGAPIYRVA